MTIPVIEAAYAAGLFDGEGSISIPCSRATGREKRYHRVHVSISNTNMAMLAWLKERFGGAITCHRPQIGNSRASARWQATSCIAEQFLRTVRPHLIVKAMQADIALELLSTRREHEGYKVGFARGTIPVNPVTDELFAYREQLRQRLMQINKRGIS